MRVLTDPDLVLTTPNRFIDLEVGSLHLMVTTKTNLATSLNVLSIPYLTCY